MINPGRSKISISEIIEAKDCVLAEAARLYLVMDIGLHWSLLRNLKNKVQFSKTIVVIAILLDAIVLTGFLWIKAKVDLPLIIVAFSLMVIIFFGEKWFLKSVDEN